MPHQFAAEFQRNRIKSISEQVQNYRLVKKQLETALEQNFKPKHRHPFITNRSMQAVKSICKELDAGLRHHEELFDEDPYFDRLTALFEGRVGHKPTPEQLSEMHADAKRRYAESVPPGYADSKKKPEPEAFGDYVGWKQILEHCKAKGTALILITDDQKEDWWYIWAERRIGPRPELIAEYRAECQQSFYMYSLAQFIDQAPEHLGRRVARGALQEVRERSAEKLKQEAVPKAAVETERVPTPAKPVLPAFGGALEERTEDGSDSKAESPE